MEKRKSIRRIFLASFSFLFVTTSLLSKSNFIVFNSIPLNKANLPQSKPFFHKEMINKLICYVIKVNNSTNNVLVGGHTIIRKLSNGTLQMEATEESKYYPSTMTITPDDKPTLEIKDEDSLPFQTETGYGSFAFLDETREDPCPLSFVTNTDYPKNTTDHKESYRKLHLSYIKYNNKNNSPDGNNENVYYNQTNNKYLFNLILDLYKKTMDNFNE